MTDGGFPPPHVREPTTATAVIHRMAEGDKLPPTPGVRFATTVWKHSGPLCEVSAGWRNCRYLTM